MSGAPGGPKPAGTAEPEGAGAQNPDLSMEDILASIRRILSEDEHPSPAKPADDVLTLDPSMMVQEPKAPAQPVAHPPETLSRHDGGGPVWEKEPPMQDVPPAGADPGGAVENRAAPAVAGPVFDAGRPATGAPGGGTLVSPSTEAAAAGSVEALRRQLAAGRATHVYRGGPTLEDLVREEMRPLLQGWLDNHLPPLVERLVRSEIERLVNRSMS